MEIKISYDEALKNFPEKVKEVICKVEASKSKLKNINPESWQWRISWAVRCGKVIGFDDLINAIKSQKKEKCWQKFFNKIIESKDALKWESEMK